MRCESSVNVKSDFDVRTLASDVVGVAEIDDSILLQLKINVFTKILSAGRD